MAAGGWAGGGRGVGRTKEPAGVGCVNGAKGAQTTKVCKVGCSGCMKCVKACEYGAVQVENFGAKGEPAKCVGCGKCVEACPRHVITLLDV